MRHSRLATRSAIPPLPGVVAALLALSSFASSAPAVTPITPQKTGGKVTVNGKPLAVNHAYLFHAPDNWEESEINSVVLISPSPLDEAKLKQARTLRDALQFAPQRVVVEARSGGKADISICHPAFGDGMCYSTTVSGADEWKEEPAAAGHFAGHLRVFGGQAWKVFEKYDLFYDLTFDAAPVADFKSRR